MMKCTDIQIDDYVMLNDTVYKVEEISKQGWIHLTCNGVRVQMTSDYLFDVLKGVPLTNEILKKNGFKYYNGEVGMYGVTTASYYMLKDSPFRLYCDGCPYAVWFEDEVDIKYVHQLQHVLRLCRIEKEIKL